MNEEERIPNYGWQRGDSWSRPFEDWGWLLLWWLLALKRADNHSCPQFRFIGVQIFSQKNHITDSFTWAFILTNTTRTFVHFQLCQIMSNFLTLVRDIPKSILELFWKAHIVLLTHIFSFLVTIRHWGIPIRCETENSLTQLFTHLSHSQLLPKLKRENKFFVCLRAKTPCCIV